jgi:hypothetical protein
MKFGGIKKGLRNGVGYSYIPITNLLNEPFQIQTPLIQIPCSNIKISKNDATKNKTYSLDLSTIKERTDLVSKDVHDACKTVLDAFDAWNGGCYIPETEEETTQRELLYEKLCKDLRH